MTDALAVKALQESPQTRGAASLAEHRAARAGTTPPDARRISAAMLLADCARAARRWTKGVRRSEVDTVASEAALRIMALLARQELAPYARERSAALDWSREQEILRESGGRLPLRREWIGERGERTLEALQALRNATSAVVKNPARWRETPAPEDLTLDAPEGAALAQVEAQRVAQELDLVPDATAAELADVCQLPLNAARTIERAMSSWSTREAAAVWGVSEKRAEKIQAAGRAALVERNWHLEGERREALLAASAELRRRAASAFRRALGELASAPDSETVERARAARMAAHRWRGLQLTAPEQWQLEARSAALWVDTARQRGYADLKRGACSSVKRGELANPAALRRRSHSAQWRAARVWSAPAVTDDVTRELESIHKRTAAYALRCARWSEAIEERRRGAPGAASIELERAVYAQVWRRWQALELDAAYSQFFGARTPLRAIDAAQWDQQQERRELAQLAAEDE